jgi:hypothetical protein
MKSDHLALGWVISMPDRRNLEARFRRDGGGFAPTLQQALTMA